MSTDIVPELEATKHSRVLAHWSKTHPAFKDDHPTVGERAADKMRHSMGSWIFVFAFVAFMGVWAILNTLVLKHAGYDPFPYVLLNLFLSMLAGLQGAILLISAKRADAISGKLAMHTDLEATRAEERAQHVEEMVQDIHAALAQSVERVPGKNEASSSKLERGSGTVDSS